ncbi:MAG: hypothetical protein R3344_06470 [Acidobacteriota bacterium]|nr:hypothetical protein [Acidobacteriota bacterium]
MARQVDMPVAVMRHDAGANINAAASDNLVDWTVEVLKDENFYSHSTVTNPSRITVARAGRYLIRTILSFNTLVANYTGAAKVRTNGSTVDPARGKAGVAGGFGGFQESSMVLPVILDLSADDYVEVLVDRINATGSVTLTGSESAISIVALFTDATVAPWAP